MDFLARRLVAQRMGPTLFEHVRPHRFAKEFFDAGCRAGVLRIWVAMDLIARLTESIAKTFLGKAERTGMLGRIKN